MTKDEFIAFRNKQNELYDKYIDCTDWKSYDNMNKEWKEWLSRKNFKTN